MAKGIATVLKGDRHTTAKTMESIEELVKCYFNNGEVLGYCAILFHFLTPSSQHERQD